MRARLAVAVAATALLTSALVPLTADATPTFAPVITEGVHIADDHAAALAVASGHVFLATIREGFYDGPLVVTDTTGTVVGTVAGVEGATSLVVSADDTHVYALSPRTRSIEVIDAVSFTRTASYVLPATCVPAGLVPLGQTVWFSYGQCGENAVVNPDAGVGVIDLSDPDATATLVTRTGVWTAPAIGGNPADPSTLLVTSDYTFSKLTRYAVSGVDLTPQQTLTMAPGECGMLQFLPVGPDGILRLRCLTFTTSERLYRANDLTLLGTLPFGSSQRLAIAGPTGLLAAGIPGMSPDNGIDWYVFSADGTLRRTYTFNLYQRQPKFLAWGADGTLYGVSDDRDGSGHDRVNLHVMTDVAVHSTVVTLTAPTAAVPATSDVVVHGSLASTDTDPAATAGKQLSITRTRLSDSASTTLPPQVSATDATFTITDRVPAGTYRYTVTAAGDPDHDGAQATTATVTVAKVASVLSLTVTPSQARYGQVVTIRARLSSPVTNRVVSLYAATAGQRPGPAHLIRTSAVAADGTLTATVRVLASTSFTATSSTDGTYTAATAKTLVRVAPDIALVQQGYYRTSGAYRVYHHRSDPRIGYVMRPWPGRLGGPAVWTLQKYRSGHWSTLGAAVFPVAQNSGIVISAAKLGKGSFRVRLTNLGQDGYSSPSTSGWAYVRIVT